MTDDFDEQLEDFMTSLDEDQTVIELTIKHNGKQYSLRETIPLGYPVNTVAWMTEEMVRDITKMIKQAEE